MKIEIQNNTAIGLLEFYSDVNISEKSLKYLCYGLYNIECLVWYDIEQNIVLMQMRGSIVSMMQLRKFFLMNYPNALKE